MAYVRKILFVLVVALATSGCMTGYILKSAHNQTKLLKSRVPIKKVLKEGKLTDEEQRKLKLAVSAKKFAEKMGLEKTDNYESFVQLDRPYVSYIVIASPAYELKQHLWWFPLVGNVPYKGYFNEQDAKDEAATFDPEKFDTYVRGASAYSTLGWFDDPVLSSMLRYRDYNLVNLIIHETVHATLYIKSNADFNERLATFLGDKGTELYYIAKEGKNSPTLKTIAEENRDTLVFSEFLSKEIKSLEQWYIDNKNDMNKEKKTKRLEEIRTRYMTQVLPNMKGPRYNLFHEMPFNNASLLSLNTYVGDLTDFEKLYSHFGGDLKKFLEFCKGLEKVDDPVAEVKKFLAAKN